MPRCRSGRAAGTALSHSHLPTAAPRARAGAGAGVARRRPTPDPFTHGPGMPHMDSIQAACLVAAAAALVAAVPAAAGSGAPAPLKQMDAGAEAGDILCNGDRVLLVSPGGAPACIFTRSLDMLADRGWREGPEGGAAMARRRAGTAQMLPPPRRAAPSATRPCREGSHPLHAGQTSTTPP